MHEGKIDFRKCLLERKGEINRLTESENSIYSRFLLKLPLISLMYRARSVWKWCKSAGKKQAETRIRRTQVFAKRYAFHSSVVNWLNESKKFNISKISLLSTNDVFIYKARSIQKWSQINLLMENSAKGCHWEVFFMKCVLFFQESTCF